MRNLVQHFSSQSRFHILLSVCVISLIALTQCTRFYDRRSASSVVPIGDFGVQPTREAAQKSLDRAFENDPLKASRVSPRTASIISSPIEWVYGNDSQNNLLVNIHGALYAFTPTTVTLRGPLSGQFDDGFRVSSVEDCPAQQRYVYTAKDTLSTLGDAVYSVDYLGSNTTKLTTSLHSTYSTTQLLGVSGSSVIIYAYNDQANPVIFAVSCQGQSSTNLTAAFTETHSLVGQLFRLGDGRSYLQLRNKGSGNYELMELVEGKLAATGISSESKINFASESQLRAVASTQFFTRQNGIYLFHDSVNATPINMAIPTTAQPNLLWDATRSHVTAEYTENAQSVIKVFNGITKLSTAYRTSPSYTGVVLKVYLTNDGSLIRHISGQVLARYRPLEDPVTLAEKVSTLRAVDVENNTAFYTTLINGRNQLFSLNISTLQKTEFTAATGNYLTIDPRLKKVYATRTLSASDETTITKSNYDDSSQVELSRFPGVGCSNTFTLSSIYQNTYLIYLNSTLGESGCSLSLLNTTNEVKTAVPGYLAAVRNLDISFTPDRANLFMSGTFSKAKSNDLYALKLSDGSLKPLYQSNNQDLANFFKTPNGPLAQVRLPSGTQLQHWNNSLSISSSSIFAPAVTFFGSLVGPYLLSTGKFLFTSSPDANPPALLYRDNGTSNGEIVSSLTYGIQQGRLNSIATHALYKITNGIEFALLSTDASTTKTLSNSPEYGNKWVLDPATNQVLVLENPTSNTSDLYSHNLNSGSKAKVYSSSTPILNILATNHGTLVFTSDSVLLLKGDLSVMTLMDTTGLALQHNKSYSKGDFAVSVSSPGPSSTLYVFNLKTMTVTNMTTTETGIVILDINPKGDLLFLAASLPEKLFLRTIAGSVILMNPSREGYVYNQFLLDSGKVIVSASTDPLRRTNLSLWNPATLSFSVILDIPNNRMLSDVLISENQDSIFIVANLVHSLVNAAYQIKLP